MCKLIYVPSQGSIWNVDYILVGEAPGAAEERERLPFVGRSGKLLRETFKDKAIYITNVIKVRPENNRAPSIEEIDSWTAVLAEEILQIQDHNPRAEIVALGNVAKTALELLSFDHYHIWHPSYVLRFNKQKEWKNSIKEILEKSDSHSIAQ